MLTVPRLRTILCLRYDFIVGDPSGRGVYDVTIAAVGDSFFEKNYINTPVPPLPEGDMALRVSYNLPEPEGGGFGEFLPPLGLEFGMMLRMGDDSAVDASRKMYFPCANAERISFDYNVVQPARQRRFPTGWGRSRRTYLFLYVVDAAGCEDVAALEAAPLSNSSSCVARRDRETGSGIELRKDDGAEMWFTYVEDGPTITQEAGWKTVSIDLTDFWRDHNLSGNSGSANYHLDSEKWIAYAFRLLHSEAASGVFWLDNLQCHVPTGEGTKLETLSVLDSWDVGPWNSPGRLGIPDGGEWEDRHMEDFQIIPDRSLASLNVSIRQPPGGFGQQEDDGKNTTAADFAYRVCRSSSQVGSVDAGVVIKDRPKNRKKGQFWQCAGAKEFAFWIYVGQRATSKSTEFKICLLENSNCDFDAPLGSYIPPPGASWKFCADRMGHCVCDGGRVRIGNPGIGWSDEKPVQGGIDCRDSEFESRFGDRFFDYHFSDDEPVHCECRLREPSLWRPILSGATADDRTLLEEVIYYRGYGSELHPVALAHDLGQSTWILGVVIPLTSELKMVKVNITGSESHRLIESRQDDNPSAECRTANGFNSTCFEKGWASWREPSVRLKATQETHDNFFTTCAGTARERARQENSNDHPLQEDHAPGDALEHYCTYWNVEDVLSADTTATGWRRIRMPIEDFVAATTAGVAGDGILDPGKIQGFRISVQKSENPLPVGGNVSCAEGQFWLDEFSCLGGPGGAKTGEDDSSNYFGAANETAENGTSMNITPGEETEKQSEEIQSPELNNDNSTNTLLGGNDSAKGTLCNRNILNSTDVDDCAMKETYHKKFLTIEMKFVLAGVLCVGDKEDCGGEMASMLNTDELFKATLAASIVSALDMERITVEMVTIADVFVAAHQRNKTELKRSLTEQTAQNDTAGSQFLGATQSNHGRAMAVSGRNEKNDTIEGSPSGSRGNNTSSDYEVRVRYTIEFVDETFLTEVKSIILQRHSDVSSPLLEPEILLAAIIASATRRGGELLGGATLTESSVPLDSIAMQVEIQISVELSEDMKILSGEDMNGTDTFVLNVSADTLLSGNESGSQTLGQHTDDDIADGSTVLVTIVVIILGIVVTVCILFLYRFYGTVEWVRSLFYGARGRLRQRNHDQHRNPEESSFWAAGKDATQKLYRMLTRGTTSSAPATIDRIKL